MLAVAILHLRGFLRGASFPLLAVGAGLLILVSESFSIFSFGRRAELVQELIQSTMRLAALCGAAMGAGVYARVSRRSALQRSLVGSGRFHCGAFLGLLTGQALLIALLILPAGFISWRLGAGAWNPALSLSFLGSLLESGVLLSLLLFLAVWLGPRDLAISALCIVVAGQMVGHFQAEQDSVMSAVGWLLLAVPDLRLFQPSAPLSGESSNALEWLLWSPLYAAISVVIWSVLGILAVERQG